MTPTQPLLSSSYPSCITTEPMIASQWLKQGELLAYPTESVWGIGCDAMNEQAVIKILTIKQRHVNKGLIVLTDATERLVPLLASLTNKQCQRLKKSWQAQYLKDQPPQAQTQASTWLLPLPHGINLPHWLTGEHGSLAVRVIAHPVIQQVCRHMVSADNPFGFIVSTSCNPSGQAPAKTLPEAICYFGDDIGYLQGDTLGYHKPSQIKDAITGKVIR